MNETNRRSFLKNLGLGAAALTAAGCSNRRAASVKPDKPNVLFILTDDQREDTIAALGNPHIQTPNLDALAQSGVVFTNAYCMGGFCLAICTPSRMMLLRGRSWFSVLDLPKGFSNFPTTMKAAGYDTFFFGKRGNSDPDVQSQFADCRYVQPRKKTEISKRDPDTAVRLEGIPGQQLANGAIDFLRRRDRSKPFFMYLAGPEPHDPRRAPKKYLDRYPVDKMPLPANFLPFHPFDNGEMFVRDERLAAWPRTEGEIREHLRDYYAVITYMDEQLGRIFAELKEQGDYDNTIIVFTSDQGLAVGSHGLMGKQSLYEEAMGVPLIFAGPGIPKGGKSDAFAYLFDLFPTVCDLVGVPRPNDLEGKSLAPVIRGKQSGVRDTLFLAYRDFQRAVRQGRWKLIRYPRINKTQLFDLETDPNETKDLSSDPAHAEKINSLMKAMAEQQKIFNDRAPLSIENPGPGDVDLSFFAKAPAQ